MAKVTPFPKKEEKQAEKLQSLAKESAPEPKQPKEAPRSHEKEEIVYLKLSDLFPFKDHPFQVRNDEEMRAMVESVKDKGVTQPAIVRPRADGGYSSRYGICDSTSVHRKANIPIQWLALAV